MSAAKAAPRFRVLAEPTNAQWIATELRGMAGELMARYDVAHGRLSAKDAAFILLARADEVEAIR